jgi:hypothetical protein
MTAEYVPLNNYLPQRKSGALNETIKMPLKT